MTKLRHWIAGSGLSGGVSSRLTLAVVLATALAAISAELAPSSTLLASNSHGGAVTIRCIQLGLTAGVLASPECGVWNTWRTVFSPGWLIETATAPGSGLRPTLSLPMASALFVSALSSAPYLSRAP